MRIKGRTQINIMLTPEDRIVVDSLKEKYGINISGCVKTFLKQHLEQLEQKKISLNP